MMARMMAPLPPADAATFYLMLFLGAGVPLLFAWTHFNHRATVMLVAVSALLVTGLLAWHGVFRNLNSQPPAMLLVASGSLACCIGLGVSQVGRQAARRNSFALLIGFQAFRLPLELVMYRAARLGLMPVEFSFVGWNFDILTGITALGLGLCFKQQRIAKPRIQRWLIAAWNAWGIACLTVIFILAVASSPNVRALGDAPDKVNTWVLAFPYAWLPTLLVSVALLGHVLVMRKLFSKRELSIHTDPKT